MNKELAEALRRIADIIERQPEPAPENMPSIVPSYYGTGDPPPNTPGTITPIIMW